MKNIILNIYLIALFSSSIFSANGINLIGLLPESRAMGGIGVGMPLTGHDSINKNPAWVSELEGFKLTMGLNLVNLDHKAQVNLVGIQDSGLNDDQSDFFAIPEIAISQKLNDSMAFGLALFTTSGFSVDFSNMTGYSNMTSYLQSSRIVSTIAYKKGNFRAGVSPILSYNAMSLGADMPDSSSNIIQRGSGVSDSFGYTYQVGLGYYINRLSIGTTYMAPMDMSFKRLFDFNADGTYDTFDIAFPSEYGVGVGVDFSPVRVGFDWKRINWGDAEGFSSFSFNNQDVYAIGADWNVIPNKLVLRAGFNYGKSPIRNTSSLSPANGATNVSTGQFLDSQIAMFTTSAIPGIAESTYNLGLGYWFTDRLGVDLSYSYMPQVEVTQTGQTALSADTIATPSSWANIEYASKLSVSVVSFAFKWAFE